MALFCGIKGLRGIFLHTNKLRSVFGITAYLVRAKKKNTETPLIPPRTIHQNLFISEQGGRTKGCHK